MALERRRLFGLLVFALWAAGTGLLIWLMLIYPNQPLSTTYKDFAIELEEPVSPDSLSIRLEREGVIRHPRALAVYLRLIGAAPALRSGFVVVNKGLSVRALLPRLARGFGTSRVRVLLPEGFTRFDTATRLSRYGIASRQALLDASTDPVLLARLKIPGDSLEGYLFPAMYDFMQESDPEAVLSRMVRVFRERTRALFDAYARDHDGAPFSLTPHELLTLASIVEREARVPEERPVIAGVFLNRLRDPSFKPRRLQADPTAAYGCLVAGDKIPSCAGYDGRRITPAMLRDPENPYSTYRRDGLPPGPICSPGLSSIRAALSPTAHDYFYFVTKGGGRHAFSHSLEEHNQRVRESP